MERETGVEPATSSLGKCYYFDFQGFSELLLPLSAMEFPQFPGFGREWNPNGITPRAIARTDVRGAVI
jgi:hypothetical protein